MEKCSTPKPSTTQSKVNVLLWQFRKLQLSNTEQNKKTMTRAIATPRPRRVAAKPSYQKRLQPAVITPREGSRLTPEQVFLQEIIRKKGYTLTQIALELDTSKASVSRLLSGNIRQANNKLFSKLLGLYCAVCCVPRHDVSAGGAQPRV